MNELKVKLQSGSAEGVTFKGLDAGGLYTAAEMIRATEGGVVFDTEETFDTPFGRQFARAVIQLAADVLKVDAAPALSLLDTAGRAALCQATHENGTYRSVIQRLAIQGGGNTVNFILTKLGLGKEEIIEALCSILTGGKGYVPTVSVPEGAKEVILRQGHAEYHVTFTAKGPKIKAVPYRMPAGGERWADSDGNEYLIAAGAEQAVNLKLGTVIPLEAGALAGTIRGVNFIYKSGGAA